MSLELGAGPDALRDGMLARLGERYGIAVRVMPEDALAGTLRHYDFHRRRLMLSERLPAESRLFGIAYQLALHAMGKPIGGDDRSRGAARRGGGRAGRSSPSPITLRRRC